MTRGGGVLITRPEPGASATAERVATLGFVPIVCSAIEIVAVAARLPAEAGITALAVPSGNVLAACFPAFRATPLFAVGDATAGRAIALGFSDVRSAGADAAALAALIGGSVDASAGAILLPSGRGQSTALAAMLRGRGFRVVRRVVYAARPLRTLPENAISALETGSVSAALFFSAETARSFVRSAMRAGLTERLAEIDAISIGRAAGVALQSVRWRRISVAEAPTQDAMLALLR